MIYGFSKQRSNSYFYKALFLPSNSSSAHIPTWSSCSAIFWLHYIIYYYIIALSLFNSTSCLCMWSLSFLCKTILAYRSSKFWMIWGFFNLTFSSLRVERWLSIREISWRRRSISFLYSRRFYWHFSMYSYNNKKVQIWNDF